MKRTLIAVAFVTAASTVSAGNLSDPVVDPEIIVTETVKSAGNDDWVIALMTFAVFIMAAMN